ncbi:hypothetical protein LCGC14_1775630 [marine sediment metagenome]|uniref:Uncharacterized protein n=1 Tax=marine sediment metagenome TaxID=412755 RepID=A0A0F9GWY3_9ZZZZ
MLHHVLFHPTILSHFYREGMGGGCCPHTRGGGPLSYDVVIVGASVVPTHVGVDR